MTKLLKLSLVASLALAANSASAADLSEAIKNTDISGSVVYRYNDYSSTGNKSSSGSNNYQVAVSLTTKVNDDVKFNSRIRTNGDTGVAGLDTGSTGDQAVDIQLTEANFTYTGVQNLSLTLGKQAINSPWTVSRDVLGNEATGTGATAIYTAGPVTLVGAYFNQTNFGTIINTDGVYGVAGSVINNELGSKDMYTVGAIANFSGVSVEGFYGDLADEFTAYSVAVNAKYNLGSVAFAPFARYSVLSPEAGSIMAGAAGTTEDQTLWQVGTSANVGIFSAFLAYGESGEDGGLVSVDVTGAANMDYHWRITANGSANTDYLYANVNAKVTEKLTLGLYHTQANRDVADSDELDYYAQARYQFSKNLFSYVRFGQYDSDKNDEKQDMGRLHVQYSF